MSEAASDSLDLLEHTPVAVFVLGVDGTILAHNTGMQVWLGARGSAGDDGLCGRNIVEWLTAPSRMLYETQVMPRLLETGRLREVMLEVRDSSGERRAALVNAELRHTVAYMTQAASVYRDLSVTHNVRYFAALAGAGSRRADEVVDQVGLSAHRTQLAGNLSGGQLSRVSLACALVGDPAVLVLDEPTVGQDPVLREELWADFRSRAASGTTVLVSSHVMDEATRCDDLLLLRAGELIAHDDPGALLERTGATDLDAAFLDLVRGPSQEV